MIGPVLGEEPIRTETGVHPFDAVELGTIRNVCQLRMGDGERLLNAEYAAAVMPAMADKIEQLRTLVAEARATGAEQLRARTISPRYVRHVPVSIREDLRALADSWSSPDQPAATALTPYPDPLAEPLSPGADGAT